MPASTTSEPKIAVSLRDEPFTDPNNKHYPRSKWFKLLRWFFARFWWVAAAIYFPLVISNLIVLGLQQGGGALLDSANWLTALELDKLLPQLQTQHPWWVSIPSLAIVGLFILLGYLASKDQKREQEALKRHKEHEEQAKLAAELRAATEEQTKDIAFKAASEIGKTTASEIVTKIDERLAEQSYFAGSAAAPQGPPFDHMELLPAPEHFVGRQEDLDWLLQQVQPGKTAAIIALGGLGGIGKTALAAVAVRELRKRRRFSDGVAVVLCQGLTDPAEVLRRVLTRFDPYRRAPEAVDLEALGNHAQRLLNQKKALVVMDNVEPELADLDKVVAPLRAAGATLLLTARHTLPRAAVPLEASRTLDLLSDQEALDLFAQSLGRTVAASLSPGEQAAAGRIIAALERHTLAVKLAGAYAADVKRDLATLAAELESDPLKVPEGETPRAVALAFAKSTEALPYRARWIFAMLAAFPTAEFSRQAVLTMLGATNMPDPETSLNLLVLRRLVDASTNETMPEGSARERLRLHQLMRSFAAAHFALWPEEQRQIAHLVIAQYYATYTNAMPDTALDEDEVNITAILKWVHEQEQNELTAELCLGMRYFWHNRWRIAESLRYLPWGLAAAKNIANDTQKLSSWSAGIANSYGQVLLYTGAYHEAELILADALTLCRNREDWYNEGAILSTLGEMARRRGQLEAAEGYFKKSLAIYQINKDESRQPQILHLLASIALQRGNLEVADSSFNEGLEISRREQYIEAECINLSGLAQVAIRRRQLDSAETYSQQALLIARKMQFPQIEAGNLVTLGDIALKRGQLDVAETYFQQALAISHQIQDYKDESGILNWLGQIYSSKNQLEKAEGCFKEALIISRKMQHRQSEGISLAQLGRIALKIENFEEAESLLQQALLVTHEVQDPRIEGFVLSDLATLALLHGQFEVTERYLQQALGNFQKVQDQEEIGDTLDRLAQFNQVRELVQTLDSQKHGGGKRKTTGDLLDALLDTDSLAEKQLMLERQQSLFLTRATDRRLATEITRLKQSHDPQRAEKLAKLELHRALFRRARQEGMLAAWVRFQTDWQAIIKKKEKR